MEVIISETPKETAALAVEQALLQYQTEPVLVLLSGGSWLPVYDLLTESLFTANLTFMLGDERYSVDDEVNNFAQLKVTDFYKRALARGCGFIDTSVMRGETLEGYGGRFAAALAAWQTAHPESPILALLGMGQDGHTAGIFPGTLASELVSTEDTYQVVLADKLSPIRERVTVNAHFLANKVSRAVVYAAGKNKCQRLDSVITNLDYDPAEPARVWHLLPLATLITDCPRHAAAEI